MFTKIWDSDILYAYTENGGMAINGYEEQYFEVTCENERLKTYYG